MSKIRILIVEDEFLLAEKLKERLIEEGFEADYEADGQNAWEKAQEWCPDLIILDIQLPTMDGLTFCRLIRRSSKLAQVPIIMMTSRGMEVDKIVALEIGADDYLVKPVSLNELLARIRALLRRTPPPAHTSELEVNGLRVDLLSCRVYLDGNEIRMTNKEFKLLATLIQNAGTALSRDLILTKAWDSDTFIDKRTVDVHIRWIREKIEEDPANPRRITTVRSIGYRLER